MLSTRSTSRNGKRWGRRSRIASMSRTLFSVSVISFLLCFAAERGQRPLGLGHSLGERVELPEARRVSPPLARLFRGQAPRVRSGHVDRFGDDAAKQQQHVVADLDLI